MSGGRGASLPFLLLKAMMMTVAKVKRVPNKKYLSSRQFVAGALLRDHHRETVGIHFLHKHRQTAIKMSTTTLDLRSYTFSFSPKPNSVLKTSLIAYLFQVTSSTLHFFVMVLAFAMTFFLDQTAFAFSIVSLIMILHQNFSINSLNR